MALRAEGLFLGQSPAGRYVSRSTGRLYMMARLLWTRSRTVLTQGLFGAWKTTVSLQGGKEAVASSSRGHGHVEEP